MQITSGSFDQLTSIRIEMKSKDQVLSELEIENKNEAIQKLNEFSEATLASEFVEIDFPTKPKKPIETTLKLKNPPKLMQSTFVYRFNPDYLLFTKITTRVNDCPSKITFDITDPGVYIARNESSYTALIVCLVVISTIILIGVILGIYFWRNPKYLERIRYSACNVKRSMSDQI